jgi:translation elongation factor P/translation initiation factor 5A
MREIKHFSRGDYILHKDEPCRIEDLHLVVFGTHSHAKMKLTVKGLFTGLNETFSVPNHERLQEVDIIKKSGQLIAKGESKAQIMDNMTYETFDADIDPSAINEITEGDTITYVEFNGTARVMSKR